MKLQPLPITAFGLAGLVTAGLMALPASAAATGFDEYAKRDDDAADVVLVNDDDDDNDDDGPLLRDDTTRSRSGNSGDNSRTGANSGRDDSRSRRAVKDWTGDNTNTRKRDWSRNHTNDRSRHNTR